MRPPSKAMFIHLCLVTCTLCGCSSDDPIRPVEPTAVAEIALVEDNRVFFDARASSHPDGELDSYVWEFGDGTTCPPDCGTTLPPSRPAHAYAESGTYSVTLTVSRGGGPEARAWLTARVGDRVLTGPWQYTYDVTIGDRGHCLAAAAGDGYVLAGTRGTGTDPTDLFLLRTDAAGEQLWLRTYGGVDYDQANGVLATGDGGYLLTGMY